ncbi:hypothetical protein [Streptomyces sp. YGL11-2]|uniref:hypothetical protein n=1 Tax=Streptomyces sp. YGL11-2 TaxID=3414028 RepID=UPI003CEBAB69
MVTADALHMQRDRATELVEEFGADYLFTVKHNQPALFTACTAIPWRSVRKGYRSRERGHGHAQTLILHTVIWTDWDFPHLAQVARITRRRSTHRTGKRLKETVYVITPDQQEPISQRL